MEKVVQIRQFKTRWCACDQNMRVFKRNVVEIRVFKIRVLVEIRVFMRNVGSPWCKILSRDISPAVTTPDHSIRPPTLCVCVRCVCVEPGRKRSIRPGPTQGYARECKSCLCVCVCHVGARYVCMSCVQE